MATTSDVKVTPGTGKNVATYSFTEDTETKEAQRVALNESDGTDTAVAAKLGSLTETAPATDTASSGLNGRLQRIAQRITSLIALLPTALGTGGGLKVDGSGTALPVSLASAPSTPVTNTGTFATQATLQTQTDTVMVGGVNIKEINAVAPLMGNGITGTGSQRVTVASDNTPFPVKTDQTTHGTTDLVAADITKIAGTAIVNGGLAGSQSVGGIVATNVAITDNPVNIGGQGVSSENSVVTTGRKVQAVFDLVGKQIVLPYANPENFVSGLTAAMTGTTTTSLLAAPASGLRNYITHIIATNSHATVGTFVIIQDGSGGTTLYEGYCAPAGGGFSISFPTPLRQPTTATAIFCADVTTGANVIVSASGYKGA